MNKVIDLRGIKLRPLDLQMFAEALQGKQLIYLFRIRSKATEEAATVIAFQTEGERTASKDADSTATKDGSIRTPGVAEIEISVTSIMAVGDVGVNALETAMLDDELVECWEVNRAEKGTSDDADKYKAKYYQGYITEVSISASAEDMVEASITFGANGNGKDGYATLSAEQEAAADYVFKDTTQESQ